MKTIKLSDRQYQALEIIEALYIKKNKMPTYAAIAKKLKIKECSCGVYVALFKKINKIK